MAGKDGHVFVLVMEVRGLSSDKHYFCKVYLDKTKAFKTQTLDRTENPKWEEHARHIKLNPAEPADKLRFALFSHTLWDSCLAEYEISLSDLYNGVPRDEWFPLKKSAKSKKVKGEMHAQILYLEPGDTMTPTYDEFPFPLQTLMKKKKFEQFKNALDAGKDLEVKDKEGNRPLHAAAQLDLPDCVQQLLDKGADIKGTDNEGALPIHRAGSHSARSVKPLVDKGSDVNAGDSNGRRPLHHAASHNNTKGILALLEHKADINAVDNDGQTALHRALQEENSGEAIKTLVDKGIDITIKDKKGIAAAELCTLPQVNQKMRKAFLKACNVMDEREFPLRDKFPKKQYVEGKNLSTEFKENPQFVVATQPGTKHLRILMHYDYEDKTVKPMEKIRFMVSHTTQNVHIEQSHQQGHIGFGMVEPFEINIEEDKVNEKNHYVIFPSSKSSDVRGYFELIIYSDGDFDVTQLVEWKHTAKAEGEWTTEKSGGAIDNNLDWLKNPKFKLTAPAGQEKLPVCIHLAQAKAALDLIAYQVTPYQFWIGFYICSSDLMNEPLYYTKQFLNAQEVSLHVDLDTTKANEFIIIPATHKPNQLTTFTLYAFADVQLQLAPADI